MSNELCWAKGYCKKYNTPLCHESCDIYVIMKALYSESNMPKIYQHEKVIKPSKSDLDKFKRLNEFKENILTNVENGQGLYIWSKGTGNGKTTWATKVMNYYFRKIVFNTGLEYEGMFVTVPSFLTELKDSFTEKTAEFDKKMDKVLKCKLLIMDDIGSEKPTEWVKERIYTIINERINEGLCTIYTSNISPMELTKTLGERIGSRVRGSSLIVELSGEDRRVQ